METQTTDAHSPTVPVAQVLHNTRILSPRALVESFHGGSTTSAFPSRSGAFPLDHRTLPLDEQEVGVLATLISHEHLTWDETAWLLAATTLALRPVLRLPHAHLLWGRLPNVVPLYPDRLPHVPTFVDIRRHAHLIDRTRPSIADLQWFLAQRLFIAHALGGEGTGKETGEARDKTK